MSKVKVSRNVLFFIILVASIALDQLTKIIVRQEIEYRELIRVLGRYITMTKVENTGAFLGLGDSLTRPLFILLMVVLPLLVIGYATYYLFTNKKMPMLLFIGISLIIGGGLGNIIDRILYGSVTDFLHFNFVLFQTGIVNMADISVTFGFFFVLLGGFIHRKELN